MNAADMFQFVVNRLESFLNSNDQILVNKERIEIVWMVRDTDNSVKGYAKIGTRYLSFSMFVNEDGEIEMWLEGIAKIIFSKETVDVFIDEIKHEEAEEQ